LRNIVIFVLNRSQAEESKAIVEVVEKRVFAKRKFWKLVITRYIAEDKIAFESAPQLVRCNQWKGR
jgi:hypothetical protein